MEKLITRLAVAVTAQINGEYVALDVDRGVYFGIKGVGNRVWSLIEFPCDLASITDTICTEFEVDRQTAETDVGNFCKSLVEAGLAEWR